MWIDGGIPAIYSYYQKDKKFGRRAKWQKRKIIMGY